MRIYFSGLLRFFIGLTALAQVLLDSGPVFAATAVEIQVSADSDDAEQDNGGGMQLTHTKIELGQMRWVGFRFTGVYVPQGATITTAYLKIRSADSNTETTNLTVFGHADDNAGTFTSSNNNISNRTRTSASANWNPVPSWSNGTWYQTPEIKTIVQEVVDRAGWTHGNSLAILILSNDLNGKRLVRAHDQAAPQAAILHVEYTFDSPVGHWILEQTTGTTATDSSVFARHGTVNGTANWSTRCNGVGTFDFNGSTNYISVSNASQYQPNTALTIAGWIRGDAWGSGADVDTILRKGEANPNNYALAISDGKVELLLDGNDSLGFRGNTLLTTGEWYHVAATWDGSNVRIYVNGVLDTTPASRTGTINTDTRSLYIGGTIGGDLFDGMIYDVRVYNRALLPEEVVELYGLTGHWKLDESSGTVAADSSGLGRNGTVIGAAAWTAGTIDNCIQLDGSTRVEVSSLIDSPKNVTLAGWANLTTPDSGGAELVSLGDYFAIRLDNGGATSALFYDGSIWTSVSVNQTFAAAGWHHFAAVFNDDQNSCNLYIDGVEAASVTTSATIPYTGLGTKMMIGTHGNGGTTCDFTGEIDDVRIYSRALCPTEIEAIHAGGALGGMKIIKWVEIQ